MNKRVTIYARVSTKDQHPENQINQLKVFANNRKWNIVNIYEEKASGTKNNRPKFQRLLDDVQKRKTDAVLVWKLDRFARSTRELLNRLDEFRSLGVEFISYTENIDTTTPAGKGLFSMVAVFAEFENDIRSERIKAGMQRAKENGKHIGRPTINNLVITKIKEFKKQGIADIDIIRKTKVSRNTLKKYIDI
jgi:DNA invertase Pin-like site-specific DNA recombinase